MFDRIDGFMSDLGRIIQKYETAKAMEYLPRGLGVWGTFWPLLFTGDFEQAVNRFKQDVKLIPMQGH